MRWPRTSRRPRRRSARTASPTPCGHTWPPIHRVTPRSGTSAVTSPASCGRHRRRGLPRGSPTWPASNGRGSRSSLLPTPPPSVPRTWGRSTPRTGRAFGSDPPGRSRSSRAPGPSMQSGRRAATLPRRRRRSAYGAKRAPCTTAPSTRSSGRHWPACGRGQASAPSARPSVTSTPTPRRQRRDRSLPDGWTTVSSSEWSWESSRGVKKSSPPLDGGAACPYLRPASDRASPASLRQSNNQLPFDVPGGRGQLLPGREVAPMATRIRPLADRLIVKRVEEQEQKSAGGIIIPDTAREKPQEGKVVAVGRGKLNDDGKVIPLDVKAGDRILFGKYSGSEIKIDGEEHLILREEDVLGVVEA